MSRLDNARPPRKPAGRRAWVDAASVALLLLAGCAAPWTVVTRADPAPFAGQRRYALSVETQGLRLNGRAAPEQGAEAQAAAAGARAALSRGFERAFSEEARRAGLEIGAEAPFAVRVAFASVDPGFFGPRSQGPSLTRAEVEILAAGGAVLERVRMESRTPGDARHASAEARLEEDGARLGESVARYLRERSLAP